MGKITRDEVIMYLQSLGIEGYESKIMNDKYYNVIKQQIFSLMDSVRITKSIDCKDKSAAEIYESTTGPARLGL